MLVIVASRYDSEAQTLASRWSDHDVHVLNCENLSVAGWRHCLPDRGASTAVIGGRIICDEEITGVLTLLPSVTTQELVHIVREDRAYVAAEMMAFLTSWLYGLSSRVLNRPTPLCLMGPIWRQEQWVHAAARIGIPIHPIYRRSGLNTALSAEVAEVAPVIVTVVGDRWFGEADDLLAEHARRLAAAAGLDLLTVHFDGPEASARLLGADLRPDVSSPEIADAILGTLRRRRGC
jgi:hypothetical protein